MWNKVNILPLLVGMQTCTITLEINCDLPNTTFGYIPEKLLIVQENLFSIVFSCMATV